MDGDPVIVVHDKTQAISALRAAINQRQNVFILSARHAAVTIGALVFKEIIDQAAREVPGARFVAALDCGTEAGRAMAAFRAGLKIIVFDPAAPASKRISDIAVQCGGSVLTPSIYDQPHLDLDTVGDPIRACDSFLIGRDSADNR